MGIDLVDLARIRDAFGRHGEQFLARVLVPAEAAYCRAHSDPVPSLAARFAAKEAVAKAFGTGIGADIGWRDIEVTRDAAGRPGIRLHGGGAKLMADRGVARIHLSLTHSPAGAAAVAILEA